MFCLGVGFSDSLKSIAEKLLTWTGLDMIETLLHNINYDLIYKGYALGKLSKFAQIDAFTEFWWFVWYSMSCRSIYLVWGCWG